MGQSDMSFLLLTTGPAQRTANKSPVLCLSSPVAMILNSPVALTREETGRVDTKEQTLRAKWQVVHVFSVACVGFVFCPFFFALGGSWIAYDTPPGSSKFKIKKRAGTYCCGRILPDLSPPAVAARFATLLASLCVAK